MSLGNGIPEGSSSPGQVVAEVEAALQVLAARGHRPVGRLAEFVAMLRRHRDRLEVDQRLLPVAFQDLHQLCAIVNQFGDCEDPVFAEKLRAMLRDPLHPADSKPETPGRDNQFELFLASTIKARNVDKITFEEPDLIVECGAVVLGIAAKRPKNANRLRPRLKEGIEQLQRAGRRNTITHGIIAVDVGMLNNPDAEAAMTPAEDLGRSAAGTRLVQPVARHIEEARVMDDLLRGQEVQWSCGVLLMGAMTEYAPEVGGVVNSVRFHMMRFGPTYRAALDRFMSNFPTSRSIGAG